MDILLKWTPLGNTVIIFISTLILTKVHKIGRQLEEHEKRLIAIETKCAIVCPVLQDPAFKRNFSNECD